VIFNTIAAHVSSKDEWAAGMDLASEGHPRSVAAARSEECAAGWDDFHWYDSVSDDQENTKSIH
jgi:hypothetical protein